MKVCPLPVKRRGSGSACSSIGTRRIRSARWRRSATSSRPPRSSTPPKSAPWLRQRIASLEAAAKYLLTQKDKNGLIGGAGFYVELPARYKWDGVTQCYTIHAFRELARLFGAVGDATSQSAWSAHADKLTDAFHAAFWRDDHFGEYVHPERGLVDLHGLSDVNWAAVAFGIAADRKLELLWPKLLAEKGFWWGDMPTQTVSKPLAYEKWEYEEPWPVRGPLAVERRRRDGPGLVSRSRRLPTHEGPQSSGRLGPQSVPKPPKPTAIGASGITRNPTARSTPAGAQKYCEYAAILTRVVLGNRDVFFRPDRRAVDQRCVSSAKPPLEGDTTDARSHDSRQHACRLILLGLPQLPSLHAAEPTKATPAAVAKPAHSVDRRSPQLPEGIGAVRRA